MKRKCSYQPFLSEFIDKELSRNKTLEIQEHIKKCRACGKEAALIRQIESAMKEAPPEMEPSTDFERSFWKKIDAFEKQKNRWSLGNFHFSGFRPIAAATLIAMLIAGFAFFYNASRISKAEEMIIAEHLEMLKDFQAIDHIDLLENWEEIMHDHEKT